MDDLPQLFLVGTICHYCISYLDGLSCILGKVRLECIRVDTRVGPTVTMWKLAAN